jgi:hypothetical protein
VVGSLEARGSLTSVLVQLLLHEERLVRVAAANLAFDVGAWVQKGRVAGIKGEEVVDGIRADEEDGEWEVELVRPLWTLSPAWKRARTRVSNNFLSVPVCDRLITDGPKELKMLNFFMASLSTSTDSDVGVLDSAVAFL